MITMYPVGSSGNAAEYHDKSFAVDGIGTADNYYLNERAAAHWEGRGAELLGWADQPVTREAFIDALEGRLLNPETGNMQDLGEWHGGERRAGFDLSIAPSKSVSVVALVGGDERVIEAHQAANSRAMQWLEDHAAVVRVYSRGEPVPVQKGNLLYATILHETDRAQQPQLHSHNVVSAVVYDSDAGKWRSLTNDSIMLLRAQADVVYKSELAKGLRAAGYELEYDKNGVDFEIKGFSAEQISAYSVRSEQIKAALKAHGIDPDRASYEARQAATLDSRARKVELPREVMHGLWRDTARDVGLDVSSILAQARERAATLAPEPEKARTLALKAVSWATEHLAEREQRFKVTDLVTAALRFEPRVAVDDVERAIDSYRKDGRLVDREQDAKGAAMLTTPKALETERVVLEGIAAGRGQGKVVLDDPKAFAEAVARFEERRAQETGKPFKLSPEQVTAARNLLMHRDAYQGIQGDAGTGKTAALAMVRDAAEAQGWSVTGIATSAAAAKELQASSGIPSQTVAGFLIDRQNAMVAAQNRIEEVRKQLADLGGTPAIERRALHVDDRTTGFDKGTYLFDHQKGEVGKANNNLMNLLGNLLLDDADRGRAPLQPLPRGDSLSTRVREAMREARVNVSGKLGRFMTSFERVGLAEATLARAALLQSRDAIERPARAELDFRLAELSNLERTGTRDGRRTLLVMDEASLTGAADMSEIVKLAGTIGARVAFQGDVKQHGSVAAGRAFSQAQDAGMQTSKLTQTQRFNHATPQLKEALAFFKERQYGMGLAALDSVQVENEHLASTVADRYMHHRAELRSRGIENPAVGVVTLTNNDRKAINLAIHDARVDADQVDRSTHTKAHLDDPKLTQAEQAQATLLRAARVDRLVFRQDYREIGVRKDDILTVLRFDVLRNVVVAQNSAGRRIEVNPMKQERFSPAIFETRAFGVGDQVEARANLKFDDAAIPRVVNGSRGEIVRIDDRTAQVQWTDGRITELTNKHLQYVDYAYAHTTYKEQGQTTDREIFAVSKVGAQIVSRESAYVAGTRARDNVEIVTSNRDKLLANADRDVGKTTAFDAEQTANRLERSLSLQENSASRGMAGTSTPAPGPERAGAVGRSFEEALLGQDSSRAALSPRALAWQDSLAVQQDPAEEASSRAARAKGASVLSDLAVSADTSLKTGRALETGAGLAVAPASSTGGDVKKIDRAQDQGLGL